MPLRFDNQVISITGLGKPDFYKALSFFFRDEKDSVEYFSIDQKYGLILYWYKCEMPGVKALPYEMKLQAASDFAWNWIENSALYPKEPDHDGDNKPGWRVYNEAWTHVADRDEALVGILPVWAMFGK